MKIEWDKVTWYSKLAAVVVFGAAFCIGLYIGMQYQFALDESIINGNSLIVSHSVVKR